MECKASCRMREGSAPLRRPKSWAMGALPMVTQAPCPAQLMVTQAPCPAQLMVTQAPCPAQLMVIFGTAALCPAQLMVTQAPCPAQLMVIFGTAALCPAQLMVTAPRTAHGDTGTNLSLVTMMSQCGTSLSLVTSSREQVSHWSQWNKSLIGRNGTSLSLVTMMSHDFVDNEQAAGHATKWMRDCIPAGFADCGRWWRPGGRRNDSRRCGRLWGPCLGSGELVRVVGLRMLAVP